MLVERRVAVDGDLGLNRLLVLSCALPYPPSNGYAMRTWGLLRALAANGHEVHLLCLGDPAQFEAQRAAFRGICQTVEVVPHSLPSLSSGNDYLRRFLALASAEPYGVARFRSAQMQATLRKWLDEGKLDALVSDSLYAMVNVPQPLATPLLLHTHNIEHVLLRRFVENGGEPVKRAYAWLESKKLARWERSAFSRASLILVCSEQDRLIAAQLCPERPSLVVPNVVDVPSYTPGPAVENNTVVYSGGMDWFPNRDAVLFFVSKILPRLKRLVPDVEFVIAGRQPPEKFCRRLAAIPGVKLTGTVPDMRPVLAQAAVCVVPLRIGSGTRLKILEAAAMEKAVVATRLGAEGLEFVDGDEIVLADDPADFADAIAHLLRNDGRRRALGRAARQRVERQYSFAHLQAALREARLCLAPAPPQPAHLCGEEVRP